MVSQVFPPRSWGSRILLLALLGLLVALVLAQDNPLTTLPSRDGGVFAYAGQAILKGKIMYVDVWDLKTPGIYYLNAFALWLGGGSRWGIWLVEFVFLLIAAGLGYRLMNRIWNSSAALFGTLVWLFALNRVLSGGNYTEEYALLFNFLALTFFWRGILQPQDPVNDLVVGLALAFSFLFRQNNIGVEISIILTWILILIFQKQWISLLKKLAWVGLAAGFVIAGVCIYFWAKGAWLPMWNATVVYDLSYGGARINLAVGFQLGVDRLGAPVWIALAGYLVAVGRFLRGIWTRVADKIALLLVIGWPVEIFLSALSGRNYIHYYMSWLPVIAMLCGLAFWQLTELLFYPKVINSLRQWNNEILAVLFILCALIFHDGIASYGLSASRLLFHPSLGIEDISSAAKYLRANSTPGDTVLAWGGQAGLNYMTDRLSPTAYIDYPIYVNSPVTQELADGFYRDVTAHPPTFIIDAFNDSPLEIPSLDPSTRSAQMKSGRMQTNSLPHLDAFFAFVQSNYFVIYREGGYTIYRLRHSSPE